MVSEGDCGDEDVGGCNNSNSREEAYPEVEIELLLVRVLVLVENESAAGEAHPTRVAGREKWLVEKDFPNDAGCRGPLVWLMMCLVNLEAPLRSIFSSQQA